jgi:hypothetical protein
MAPFLVALAGDALAAVLVALALDGLRRLAELLAPHLNGLTRQSATSA